MITTLVYGKTASLPTALKNPPKQTYNYEDYAQKTRERIRVANEAAGIHFTHLGELYIVTDSWKIVTHLKMDTLLERNRQLASYMNQLQRRCENEIAIQFTCGEHLDPLLRRAEKLYKRVDQVSEMPTYVPNKQRGLISGIGTLAKTIFGTMDADDAEQINNHLS